MISFLISLIVLACISLEQHRPSNKQAEKKFSFGALGLLFVGYLLLMTAPIALISLLLGLLVVSIAKKFVLNRAVLFLIAILPSIMVHGGILGHAYLDLSEMEVQKGEYPFESLAERLEYEIGFHEPRPNDDSSREQMAWERDDFPYRDPDYPEHGPPLVAPRPGDPMLFDISYENESRAWRDRQREQSDSFYSRSSVLSYLHSDSVDRFQIIMQFGLGRMGGVRFSKEQVVKLPPPESLYLPDVYTDEDRFQDELSWVRRIRRVDEREASRDEKTLTHVRSYLDFTNPDGWGFVRNLREAAGFQPHHFRHRPIVYDSQTQQLDEWRIVDLKLVSLLKHTTPRVYLDESLPNMERLSSENVQTRELDQFEQLGLKHLRQGSDVVFEEREETIRMLGSLRTIRACTECHHVPEGTLLGAFTYELRLPPQTISAQDEEE